MGLCRQRSGRRHLYGGPAVAGLRLAGKMLTAATANYVTNKDGTKTLISNFYLWYYLTNIKGGNNIKGGDYEVSAQALYYVFIFVVCPA